MRILTSILCIIAIFLGLFLFKDYSPEILGDAKGSAPNVHEPPVRRVPQAKAEQEEQELRPAHQYGLVRRVNVSGQKVVALTFDFCELATKTTGYNVELVQYLQNNNIHATMFLGGKWLRTHAHRGHELLKSDLFEIGNHAWSHGNFALLDAQGMQEQVDWMQAQYELEREALQNSHPALAKPLQLTLFRFPYGRSSPQALQFLFERGLHVIQWDVVGEISSDNSTLEVLEEVFNSVRPGSILLFHGNRVPKGTEELVPRLIEKLQAEGYRFVTVSTLLAMGEAEIVDDGYFFVPGDNHGVDARFGTDGTGAVEQK